MSQEALLYTRARVNRTEENRCVPYGVTSDVTGVTVKLQSFMRAVARAICLCTTKYELRSLRRTGTLSSCEGNSW